LYRYAAFFACNVYDAPFGVGRLVGVLDGRTLVNVEGYVRSIVAWLDKNA
jgi:hypothetical protein